MPFKVVCISALDGARGEEVAPAVASRLGFRILDEEVVRTAARAAGVDASAVAEVEKRRSLAIRLLDGLGSNSSVAAAARSDTNRADCLKRFHRISHESPADDDLVLNAERLGTDGTVDLVMRAAAS